jgi:hypothetical protein
MGIPYPDPIRFDHGKADAAVAAIKTVIAKLQSQKGDRWTRGQAMRVNWKGPYALHQFDPELTRMVSGANDLIGQLQSLVTTISSASARVIEDQAAHDRANQQWEEQNAPDPGVVPGL